MVEPSTRKREECLRRWSTDFVHAMNRISFTPGNAFVSSDSPRFPYTVVFEDDGETGYFYAINRELVGDQIVDAAHIYNVESVADGKKESEATIIWSSDGFKAALLINEYPHAVFDFKGKRGYCRTDFPNTAHSPNGDWITDTHRWDDAVMAAFQV